MDQGLDFQRNAMPGIKGAGFLTLCVLLHLTCVKAGGFHYSVKEWMSRFGIESMVSVMSGLSSLVLGVIMAQHYLLRNRELRREQREKREKDKHSVEKSEEEEDSK